MWSLHHGRCDAASEIKLEPAAFFLSETCDNITILPLLQTVTHELIPSRLQNFLRCSRPLWVGMFIACAFECRRDSTLFDGASRYKYVAPIGARTRRS